MEREDGGAALYMAGHYRHGHARRSGRSTEYYIWRAMMGRCHCATNKDYMHYGGRGIFVDPVWHDFARFHADMGPRPGPEYSVDRIDNNAGYGPDNCQWATRKEQSRNSRQCVKVVRSDGVVYRCVSEAAEAQGVKRATIKGCLDRPSKTVNGYTFTRAAHAEKDAMT